MTDKFVVVRTIREFDESETSVVVSGEFDSETEAETAANTFDNFNNFYDSWHHVVNVNEI